MIGNASLYQEHTLYYQNPHARPASAVTNQRVYLGSKTYAIADISTAYVADIHPNNNISIIGLIIILVGFLSGVILSFAIPGDGIYIVAGLVVLFLLFTGVWVVRLPKPRYAVKILSTVGEIDALTSADRKYIENIVLAINKAIEENG